MPLSEKDSDSLRSDRGPRHRSGSVISHQPKKSMPLSDASNTEDINGLSFEDVLAKLQTKHLDIPFFNGIPMKRLRSFMKNLA